MDALLAARPGPLADATVPARGVAAARREDPTHTAGGAATPRAGARPPRTRRPWHRPWWLVLAAVGAASLLAACGGAAATSGAGAAPTVAGPPPAAAVPRFEAAPCPFALPAAQGEGRTVACGYVVVPERHARPAGPTIRLAVARFASRVPAPAPDPVIYLAGGPGDSVQGQLAALAGAGAALFTADRAFILFDQRGVGRSRPALDCPELAAQYREDAARPLGAGEEDAHTAAAARRCRDRLAAAGVDLGAYTTAESAADVDALRAALGYRQVDLLGVSYGATLALAVLRAFPGGVRSAVLDSVGPPEARWLEQAVASYDRALALDFAACARAGACPGGAAALQAAFARAVAALDARPVTVDAPDGAGGAYPLVVTGRRLVRLVGGWLYGPATIAAVPRLLVELAGGEEATLRRLVAQAPPAGAVLAASRGQYYTVVCDEDVFADSEARAAAAGRDTAPPIRDNPAIGGVVAACRAWLGAPGTMGPPAAVTADVPALVLASATDPITPPAFGRQVAAALPRGVFVETPGIGHAVLTSPCGDRLIAAFLADPTRRPDTGCTAGLGVTFVPLP